MTMRNWSGLATQAKRAYALLSQASLTRKLGDVVRDKRGIGAVEFAILAPILLMVYIGVFELTLGFSTGKRVTRSVGAIADYVTQKPLTSNGELADVVNLAKSYIAPYSTEGLKIKINGVQIDNTMVPKVAWSWADGTTKTPVASTVAVPLTLLKPNSFLVQVEVSLPHELLMFMPSIVMESKTIDIARANFFSPRVGNSVSCGDC